MIIHTCYTECDRWFFEKFDVGLCECFSDRFELETFSEETDEIIRIPWDKIERVEIEKLNALAVPMALGVTTFEWTIKATVLLLLVSWPLHIDWFSFELFAGFWFFSTCFWCFVCGAEPTNFDRLYDVRIRCYGSYELHFYVEKTGIDLVTEIENCAGFDLRTSGKKHQLISTSS